MSNVFYAQNRDDLIKAIEQNNDVTLATAVHLADHLIVNKEVEFPAMFMLDIHGLEREAKAPKKSYGAAEIDINHMIKEFESMPKGSLKDLFSIPKDAYPIPEEKTSVEFINPLATAVELASGNLSPEEFELFASLAKKVEDSQDASSHLTGGVDAALSLVKSIHEVTHETSPELCPTFHELFDVLLELRSATQELGSGE